LEKWQSKNLKKHYKNDHFQKNVGRKSSSLKETKSQEA